MPRHIEQRQMPFTPEQLFALVADIESYPRFLPWCHGAQVLERKGAILRVEMVVGTRSLRERFVSRVALNKPESILVSYDSGPLKHLANEWRFAPDANGGCNVSFFIDFAFRSAIIGALMNAFFAKAFQKMVAAFEDRATALYGKSSG